VEVAAQVGRGGGGGGNGGSARLAGNATSLLLRREMPPHGERVRSGVLTAERCAIVHEVRYAAAVRCGGMCASGTQNVWYVRR